MNEADTGYAPQKWAFDDEVTRVFDDMLARSIPQYDVMRDAVVDIVSAFVPDVNALLFDLGCSRGETIARVKQRLTNRIVKAIGVEISAPMVEASQKRFENDDTVEIIEMNLLDDFPTGQPDVITSILTMMFVPMECRQSVIQRCYDALRPSGALVVVEKVLGADAGIDKMMVKAYYRVKSARGYSTDEIERKRLSLQGVLVPVTASWNEQLLSQAGFRRVDCFWRWMNFAAWVAIK